MRSASAHTWAAVGMMVAPAVVGVGEPGGGTSGGFHEDGVAVFGEFPHAGGGEGNAGFAGFDFFGAADNHGVFSIRVF